MRFKLVQGAAAFALAASAVRADSMCVAKDENSGTLLEIPCDNLPLHERDEGGVGGKAMIEPPIVVETSTVVVIATLTAESVILTDGGSSSTFSGVYTTISENYVTATLPVEAAAEETLVGIQPADPADPDEENIKLLYDCDVAPSDFIICPFKGPNPPPEMFPAPTGPAFHVQRDAPSPDEVSAASVLESMVSATNLWPTGVHPFVAPVPTSQPASDCVDSLADEFAMNVIYAAPLPAHFVNNKAVSNLGINLVNGTLIDNLDRLGSIVANRQLQFDAYGQAGSIYTAGFQACGPPEKRLLALGGSTTWWGCVSGAFMNLYDSNIAPQCIPLQLSLLNNQNPGGDLNAADFSPAASASQAVIISTTHTHGESNRDSSKRQTIPAASDACLVFETAKNKYTNPLSYRFSQTNRDREACHFRPTFQHLAAHHARRLHSRLSLGSVSSLHH